MAVIQKLASVQVLPLGNYANGVRNIGPIDVASDVTSVDFSVARCTTATPTIWPNASTTLAVKPEMSTDGGSTWVECGAFTSAGGIVLDKFGNEATVTIGGGSLPPQVGAVTRQYRVTTTIAGGPLRTSATVEVN